jgi:hypothetical protein
MHRIATRKSAAKDDCFLKKHQFWNKNSKFIFWELVGKEVGPANTKGNINICHGQIEKRRV